MNLHWSYSCVSSSTIGSFPFRRLVLEEDAIITWLVERECGECWRVLMCGWRKKRFGPNLLGNYEEKIECLEFKVKEKVAQDLYCRGVIRSCAWLEGGMLLYEK